MWHADPSPLQGARRRRTTSPIALLALLLAAAVALSGCTVGPSSRPPLAIAGGHRTASSTTTATTERSSPVGPGGPGRSAPPIQWHPCPGDVVDTRDTPDGLSLLCAQVTVPVSYQQPRRGSLQIAVIEAHSNTAPENAPPLVVMPNDPGTTERSDIVAVTATLPDEILDHYTIVMLDPRGTGQSAGIQCINDNTAKAIVGMAADPTPAEGAKQLTSIARQLTFDCTDAVGPALTKLDSSNAADDLDTLRAALGVDKLSIVASGGNATIGAVYAHRYPGRITSLVLDSPDNPLATPEESAAAAASAARTLLHHFAAACAAFDDGCPLGDHPIENITHTVDDLATSGTAAGPWVMTGGSVLLALMQILPDQDAWPKLATAIAALGAGKAQPLADLLTDALGGDDLDARLSGRLIYRCNDTAERLSNQRISAAVAKSREATPLFGPFAVSLQALCSQWPAPDEPITDLSTSSTPPVVVIGAAHDPLHPYPAAHAIASRLASAVLVTWQSGGSDAYPASPCVTAAVDAYLLDGTAPQRDLLCPP